MPPTTNVLQRTLLIKIGDSLGTAFTVDREGRQYIVTARHVFEDLIPDDGEIEVRHERRWKRVPVNVVGVGTGDTDVAILKHHRQLTPTHPLEPSSGGMVVGQQAYFLAFPFGWEAGAEEINNGYPIPFLKAGILSAWVVGATNRIYVDAHGNRGFSGGPLVFSPSGQQSSYKVAGVVVDSPLDPITKGQAGFVRAITIEHVVQLIDANAIGVPLSPSGAEP